MKRQNSVTIREALDLWIDTMKLRGKLNENRLIASWGKIVGSYMESKTRNIFISDRKLVVQIESSVVRNELLNAKALLLKSLNAEAGCDVIDDIIFR